MRLSIVWILRVTVSLRRSQRLGGLHRQLEVGSVARGSQHPGIVLGR